MNTTTTAPEPRPCAGCDFAARINDACYCGNLRFASWSTVRQGQLIRVLTSPLRMAPSGRVPHIDTCGPEGKYWRPRADGTRV